jgi:malonate transporter and related proteins
MDIIIEVIVPVFGVVGFGYAATFTKAFDEHAARGLSAFVFYFALPVALFRSLASNPIPEAPPLGFLAAYYLGTALMFAPAWLLTGPPGDRRTIIGFGCAYSNTVLLGIPLIVMALGEAASVPLFLLIAFHSPIFFTLVTALIELARGSAGGLGSVPRKLATALLSNVILLSVAAGLLFNMFDLALPAQVDGAAEFLARAAFPGALFSMGASLRKYRIAGAIGPTVFMVTAKLVLHPLLVAILVLGVFDVPLLWAQTAILAASLPIGINVYLFAVRYRVAEAESASAILVSNILSVASIAIVLALLGLGGTPELADGGTPGDSH